MRKRYLLTALLALFIVACGQQNKDSDADTTATHTKTGQDDAFIEIADRYMDLLLKEDPVSATLLGFHAYDNQLTDVSEASLMKSAETAKSYIKELNSLDESGLSDVNRIDRLILLNYLKSSVFSIEELKEWQWNPISYNVGNAIYPLIARDFAPLDERLTALQGRLKAIPAYLEQAKANLKNPPRVHTETAMIQNSGNIGMLEGEVRRLAGEVPRLAESLNGDIDAAVVALTAYGAWLEEELLPASNGDFRLGKDLYSKKLAFTLDSDFTKEQILESAQKDLKATQAALYETASRLHQELFGSAAPADQKEAIRKVLDKLAEEHPTNDTIVPFAEKRTKEITDFVREKDIITVPDEPVKLIVMPEFQRGVAVAYCDSPGPFEKGGETFYAISPTPEDWSDERRESFFREYNNYMLDNLTIHEAMPGHYLQLAHSNKFEAPTKIRAVFGSGVFIEGWATYAEQVMVEVGFGGDGVKMQQLKMRLRLLINAIIDQKIHTEGMTEDEAMAMMMEEGFQEEGEAAGKWRRACLTSTQLSTYYVGNMEINRIRDRYRAAHGDDADMKIMHDAMLSFGSPAPRYVIQLLGL